MRIANEDILKFSTGAHVDQPMDASFNLPAIWLGHIALYAIQLVFTGTPNGTFKLQASNDAGGPQYAANNIRYSNEITNWTDITDSAQPVAAAGNHMYTVNNPGYQWVRVVWTNSASAPGSLLTVARATVKGV